MDVRNLDDPEAFQRATSMLLASQPGRNNLALGILETLTRHPEVYPSFDLWIAERDGRPMGAAIRTHPLKLVLVDPAEAEAVDALADAVPGDVPGVVANRPWGERFIERYGRAHRVEAELVFSQGVFELTRVRDPRPAEGTCRRGRAADRDLLRRWMSEFSSEALPHQAYDRERIDRVLEVRLSDDADSGMWLWERDGVPVSIAGHTGAGSSGARIGPVYTPREHRGNGYASNLVAELSRWVLRRGNTACYLFTDLSNPTSNAIYTAIGYRQVAESQEFAFAGASG